MNLVTGSWIPVIFDKGETKLVSLKELYEKAEQISDLVLNPPQRISIMRLLVCITQAALDGPENEEDWLKCEERIIPESLKYLESRIDKFNLYDEKQPFLQVPGLSAKKKEDENSVKIHKLFCDVPSGNNKILFNRRINSDKTYSDPEIALALISFQNFATGGGQSHSLYWNEKLIDGSINIDDKGDKRGNNNFTKAPCLSQKLFSMVKGDCLGKTIWFNIIPKTHAFALTNNRDFGLPIWDQFPKDYESDNINSIRLNYISRLVPISRFLLLNKKNSQQIRFFTHGYSYEENLNIVREAMCSIYMDKDGNYNYLKVDPTKHIWRELASLLLLTEKGNKNTARTASLANLYLLNKTSYSGNVSIWSGGTKTDSNGGSFIDFSEWNVSMPVKLIGESLLAIYSKGVDLADNGSSALGKAVSKYLEFKGDDNFQTNEQGGYSKTGKKAWEIREASLSKARSHFWQTLDNEYNVLIDSVVNDKSLDGDWYNKIFAAMNRAFEYACPCVTPRQIQAFAQAQGLLRLKKNGE